MDVWKDVRRWRRRDRAGQISASLALNRKTFCRHASSALLGRVACFSKCQLWFHQPLWRLCNRVPDAFRGEALRLQALVPHLNMKYTHTHTHILALFRTRTWDKRLARWGYVRRNATVPQLSTTEELKGGDQHGEKRLNVKVLEGRLWRWTNSVVGLLRHMHMFSGSICFSWLEVTEGVSLQEDLTTRR